MTLFIAAGSLFKQIHEFHIWLAAKSYVKMTAFQVFISFDIGPTKTSTNETCTAFNKPTTKLDKIKAHISFWFCASFY